MATPASAVPPQSQQQPATVSLESAGRLVDEHLQSDAGQLELSAQLKIATHSKTIRRELENVHRVQCPRFFQKTIDICETF